MTNYQVHEFSNGIRLVHKQVHNTIVAHCGIVLDIGSRDELPHEIGLAHFWEHMAFKGTEKRKAYHIINKLESVGGELNAYTTKEKIFFYASTLQDHLNRSLDVLTDITFHSTFPTREIELEKGVIIEEMAMYLDSPEDAIYDHFEEVLFKEHPLGNNILGTKDSVNSFTHDHFKQFLARNMDTSRIVISVVCGKPFEKIIKEVAKYIEPIPNMKSQLKRDEFTSYSNEKIVVQKPIAQAHCVLGSEAFPIVSEKRIPFFILNNILGGSAMVSRLNMSLREKRGLVYSVESGFSSFTDTGMFYIYFGTEKKQLNKAKRIVFKELKLLREKELGKVQLSTVKDRLCAQLAMAEENNSALMQMMGKSILDLGHVEELEHVFREIRRVTSEELRQLANEAFNDDKFTELSYIPS